MRNQKRLLLCACSILVMVCIFVACASTQFGVVYASTEVGGTLGSDNRWTKANSPYSLIGPILVSEEVTLTVEPGVTVNFNGYYIRVNGTLVARGSSTNKIYFKDGSKPPNWAIAFTSSSSDWNEQSGSGSIIENAVLNSTGISITDAYPKISNNSISAGNAIDIFGGSPVISNNTIDGNIGVHYASPIIRDNFITGEISASSSWGLTVISNNQIRDGGHGSGIGISCSNSYISDNIISGFRKTGIMTYPNSTIVRNLIINCQTGIDLWTYSSPTIRYNTIANNFVGIEVDYALSPTIVYNNIQNNSNYNIYLGPDAENDINATYNWWGTTDPQAINQTIFDFKNDFNLGKVNFVPFLTEPNQEAPEMPESQQPDTEPEPEPEQSDLLTIIIFVALIVIPIAAGLGLLVYLSRRNS
jgi:parallel beta-helix repeat protein